MRIELKGEDSRRGFAGKSSPLFGFGYCLSAARDHVDGVVHGVCAAGCEGTGILFASGIGCFVGGGGQTIPWLQADKRRTLVGHRPQPQYLQTIEGEEDPAPGVSIDQTDLLDGQILDDERIAAERIVGQRKDIVVNSCRDGAGSDPSDRLPFP